MRESLRVDTKSRTDRIYVLARSAQRRSNLRGARWEIASLRPQMTYRVMPSNDFASALTWESSDIAFSARSGTFWRFRWPPVPVRPVFRSECRAAHMQELDIKVPGDNRDELQDHDRLRAAVVRVAHRGGGFSQSQALHYRRCERRGGGPPRHPLAGPGRSLLRNTPGGRAVEEYRHRGGDRGGHGESVPRP